MMLSSDPIARLLARGPDPRGWGSNERRPLDSSWARNIVPFGWRLFRYGVWARVRVRRAGSPRHHVWQFDGVKWVCDRCDTAVWLFFFDRPHTDEPGPCVPFEEGS